jgi:molybdopterin/thiamine biosynthesis adenylyltransferase
VRLVAHTARGALAPLTGFVGSVVAQEVIKAISGKFHPLSQWLALDAREVVPERPDPAQFQPTGTRYDELTICVGADTVRKLADTKTFMVGAGAIGCEMLKYFALLGVGTGGAGSVIVTDPDVIEESNLSRQFLFRQGDLRSLKSQAAAAAIQRMNPALKPDGYAHKLGPDTERIFTDKFFEMQDVCVNALDNVEARLYMDNRCVLTQRPLLESGTLGTKGHVQAIIPFLTESYGTRRDPPSKDFAVCTVKAFPTQIEHTIQWAKMKFSMEFQDKPTEVSKYFGDDSFIPEMARTKGPVLRTLKHVISALSTWRVQSMEDCVRWARVRFEKLFNHFPRNLLLVYPMDHRNTDGSAFACCFVVVFFFLCC